MQTYRIFAVVLAVCMSLAAQAQSEGGLLIEVGAEKKINKKFSIGVEAELRTRNNFKTIDRWSAGVSATYKFNKWLKAEAGYTLLDDNNRESTSYQTISGIQAYNNWRPSYWGIRHRVNASLTGTYKFPNNLRVSLRERWQYTYRPETTVTRWDFDNSKWEDKVRSSKGKHQLRSRLQLEYDKKHALLTPYVSVEFYNSWKTEKIRYTIGTDFNVTKQHKLGAFYRFQNIKDTNADDYDPDMHYIGISYKYKF